MTEELQKRAEQKPDQWTTAWWNQQFQEVLASNRGLKHAHHLALAEIEDLGKLVRELKETLVLMAASAEQDRAMIGQLRERLDKAGEIVKELQKAKGTK